MAFSAFGDRLDKIVLTIGVGSLLAVVASYSELNKMSGIDSLASCIILTGWAVFFLPGLMNSLNIYLIKDLFVIFFKLWTVDLIFNAYAHVRGYGNGYTYTMDDGWFFSTTGFIRAAVIVSCVVVSTITYLTKQIQRQRTKRLIMSRLRK
ncbi:hypothetical protein SNE40_000262 [Patella caerulea]|uniref:Uncharacterized protein n=1 Tax=Patella caerulea TaxID=87958 RepID=A0AAN8QGR6_PATCE